MEEITYYFKRSRRSFIHNYVIGIILFLYLFLTSALFVLDTALSLFFIGMIFIFFLEPESVLMYTSYIIKEDTITEISGYVHKKIISIPYSSISKIVTNEGLIGRIFGYGDIVINSFSGIETVILRGIKNPEKILKIIEGREREVLKNKFPH